MCEKTYSFRADEDSPSEDTGDFSGGKRGGYRGRRQTGRDDAEHGEVDEDREDRGDDEEEGTGGKVGGRRSANLRLPCSPLHEALSFSIYGNTDVVTNSRAKIEQRPYNVSFVR